jgi:hypothetical protein
MLFWLFAFILDVDHTSSQKKTNFLILFLSSIQALVSHFSTIIMIFSLTHVYMGHVFHDMLEKSIENEFCVQQCALLTSIKRRSVSQHGLFSVSRSSDDKR